MEELTAWLDANRIAYRQIDDEVVEIEDFGKVFLADLSGVSSIFKGDEGNIRFNLMENPDVLMEEDIFYAAFAFGKNWYYFDLREEFRFNLLKYAGKRQPTRLNIPYVNLGVHTGYELLNGSGELADWVRKAKYLGHTAIGICDYNTMGATLNLQKECSAAGLKPIFGYSFRLRHGDETVDMKLYCQSKEGLRNLLRIQKAIMVDSEEHTLTLRQLTDHAGGNVLVFGKCSGDWLRKNPDVVRKLKTAMGKEEGCSGKLYFQVDLTEYKAERIDVEVLKSVACYFENFADPFTFSFEIEPILICDNYYLDGDDARNKIVLNKIATGAAHEQSDEQFFKDIDEHFSVIEPLFDSEKWDVKALFERMCRNTVEIAEGADAGYETDRNFMPRYDMTAEEKTKYGDRHSMFLSLLEEGFQRLVPKGEEAVYRKRLEHEIYILESTDNVDYMLVQYDTVNWARSNGILVGCGRGSAGGCLALYLMGITLIDPIKYDLLFERFLLPERAGLYPAQATLLAGELQSEEYVEFELENGKTVRFDRDAQLLVVRDEEEMIVYADELKDGDDVVFDHKDYLWTINYINHVPSDRDRQ